MNMDRSYIINDVFSKIAEGDVAITFNTTVRIVWLFHPELW